MSGSHGDHHFHKRRIKGEVPNKDHKLKAAVDKWILFIAIVGPLTVLPQSLEIWLNKSAEAVSVLTWIGFFIIAVSWFFYGLIHKDKPIMYTNFLFMLLHISIITGALLYS